jgi:tripartite-type tricarboxylate transporter receptor subunit TctC
MRVLAIRASVVLILALTPLAGAAAQDFPSRPVRFVVPYAAGGSGDLLARLLGSKLSSLWGQQVVIDNRAGAGGLIGTEFAAAVGGGRLHALSRHRRPAHHRGDLAQARSLRLEARLHAGVDAGNGLPGADRQAVAGA